MYNSDDDSTIIRYLHACMNDVNINCDKSNFSAVYLIQLQNLYRIAMLAIMFISLYLRKLDQLCWPSFALV